MRLWSREWCCPNFHDAYNSRTQRGQFVFVGPPVPKVWPVHSFWLAFRSVDCDKLNSLNTSVFALPDIPMLISCVGAIFYCPWCGRRLARFYGRDAARLVDPSLLVEYGVPGCELFGDSVQP